MRQTRPISAVERGGVDHGLTLPISFIEESGLVMPGYKPFIIPYSTCLSFLRRAGNSQHYFVLVMPSLFLPFPFFSPYAQIKSVITIHIVDILSVEQHSLPIKLLLVAKTQYSLANANISVSTSVGESFVDFQHT